MASLAPETNNENNQSATANYDRRRKLAVLAAPIAAVALVAYVKANKVVDSVSGLNDRSAIEDINPALSKSGDTPDVIKITKVVRPNDMVSSLAADLHKYAPNQEQTEADNVIRTYLPKADQKNYVIRPGEEFTFLIDPKSGKILPKPEPQTSAEK